MNVSVVDIAGNSGSGSYSSTYIPANTAQNDVPLNDNSTMDIPGTAFDTAVQMLVKTVDVNDTTSYKPLGAAVSFEFVDESNQAVEPTAPLVIRNYIGAGLKGVALMHISATGEIMSTITAEVTTSGAFDMNDSTAINAMDTFDNGVVKYISDTGYIVFKTNNFSGYAAVQDVTAPEIVLSTVDFDINKAEKDAGVIKLAGALRKGDGTTDADTTAVISEVTVDSTAIDLTGLTAEQKNYTFDIPLALSDGTHEVVIKAVDTAGNISTMTRTYRVDSTPPTLTADTTVSSTNSDTVDISISTNETSEVLFNGVSKGYFNGSSVISFALTDGSANTINVSAIDVFGNLVTASVITVTRDSAEPVISVTGVSNNGIYGSDRTIEVLVTDPHILSSAITMDGAAYTPGTYTTEGKHTLVVSAVDTLGNIANSTITFTIDKSVPVVTVTGADEDGIYNESKTLTVTITSATDVTVTKSVDGQTPEVVAMDKTGGSLTLGAANEQHTYTVSITAVKKNEGEAVKAASDSITLTIDRKAPVLASTTASTTEAESIDVKGTVSEAADIYLDGVLAIDNNQAGTFSITGRSLVVGDNTFTVKAVDVAGNEATITITVKRTVHVDDPVVVPGGGSTGTITPVVTPITPVIIPASATITKESVLTGTTAKSATTAAEISAALEQAVKDAAGVRTISIQMKELSAAKAYEQELPASVMQAVNSKQNIAIATSIATVTIPGNMFTAAEISNKTAVAIKVAKVDSTSLTAEAAKAVNGRPVIDLSATMDGKTIAWSNADAPVTVSIPYTLSDKENPEYLVVWYIDGNGKLTAVPNARYDANTKKVTFTTTHFSKYAISYANKTFNDIANYGWARKQIEVMASKGVINGKSATTFEPGSDITRADFIVLLVKALGLTAKVDSNFADISKAAYYYEAVGTAKKLGIATGSGDNLFNPNARITRQDMMVLVYRALEVKSKLVKNANVSELSKFTDAGKVAAYAKTSVAQLVKDGIIGGSGNAVNPLENATRAETAVIIYRIFFK